MSQRLKPYLDGLRTRERHFHDGETLFRRGDPVREMHVVLADVINLARSQSEGSFLILQRAGPGSILAEASLYSETYHCDAVASGAADH